MKCAWKEFLALLPEWMRPEVDKLGKTQLQELRLRLGQEPELITAKESISLGKSTCSSDLSFCVNAASRYSPWTAQTMAKGYISCPGGHRMGLCGEAVMDQGCIRTIKNLRSLCIRVARDFPGISSRIEKTTDSILIAGPPGSGKTTLLRDLIRRISNTGPGSIGVVDERGELFPGDAFDTGFRTDILTGCSKPEGLDMLLRVMGPDAIAVDEISAEEDCHALIRAGNCGVKLLATCHAENEKDLTRRPIYAELLKSRLFDTLVLLHPDKSLRTERMI